MATAFSSRPALGSMQNRTNFIAASLIEPEVSVEETATIDWVSDNNRNTKRIEPNIGRKQIRRFIP
jgi:hypothetical protein